MSKQTLYLDYAATTPVAQSVADAMAACLTVGGNFGNAASTAHMYGWQAAEAVELARANVAALIKADVREVVFTSGATESDNLALFGAARLAHKRFQKSRVITSSIEHKAILDACGKLEEEGFLVTYIQPNSKGEVEREALEQLLSQYSDVAVVSIMHANNETGVINDVAAMGKLCREAGVLFHVDAAQTIGKLDIDVKKMCIDMLSISAHKFYGPKGIGALYVSRQPKADIEPIIYGGGHERGMRSGTLATHQIVGLGQACELAQSELLDDQARIAQLRDRLWAGISDIAGVTKNGDADNMLAGHLNVSFHGIEGETLLMSLRKLAVSSGSACNSASMKPSYVLTAMGLSDTEADSSIRFSLGKYTKDEDVDIAIEHIRTIYTRLAAA